MHHAASRHTMPMDVSNGPYFENEYPCCARLSRIVQPRHFSCCVVVSRAGKKRPAGKSGPNLIPGTVPGNQFLLLRRDKWRL
jgi:hypothetical protein